MERLFLFILIVFYQFYSMFKFSISAKSPFT